MEKVQIKVEMLVDLSALEDAPKQGDIIEIDEQVGLVWIDNNIAKKHEEKKKKGDK